jgi:hypothetical protein
LEQDKPFFVMRDRASTWKNVFSLLLMTPVVIYLLVYYFPFVLLNETIAKWSLRGVVLLWLWMIAGEIYHLIARDDLLLAINGYGIWANGCSSKNTIAWSRVVDVIEKSHPLAKWAKSDDVRVFEIIHQPDEPSTGKNASFAFNTAQLRVDPEIIRKELRKRLKADGRQLVR